MTNDKDGAALLREALRAAIEWIDAIPPEIVATLPVMPGFDRDWLDEIAALKSHGQAFIRSEKGREYDLADIVSTAEDMIGHQFTATDATISFGIACYNAGRSSQAFDAAGAREAATDPFSDANMLRSIAKDCDRWPSNAVCDGAPTSADTLREIADRIEAPASVVDREITTKPVAVSETAAGVTQGAASVEPVAWLYTNIISGLRTYSLSEKRDNYMAAQSPPDGEWIETPLYARPEPDTIGNGGHADTEGEAMALFEHLNCPACGGSVHVDDTAPPSPGFGGGDLRDAVRLAHEDADALDRVAEEADENGWLDWAAMMRQSAIRLRTLAAISHDQRGGSGE